MATSSKGGKAGGGSARQPKSERTHPDGPRPKPDQDPPPALAPPAVRRSH